MKDEEKHALLKLKGGGKLRITIKPRQASQPSIAPSNMPIMINPLMINTQQTNLEAPGEVAKAEGFSLPEIKTERTEEGAVDIDEMKKINIKYPLIPPNPRKEGRVFSYVNIFFDSKTNELVYNVTEPRLDAQSRPILAQIKEYVQEKIDVNFSQIRKGEAVFHVVDLFNKAIAYLKPRVDQQTIETLKYYVIRDFMGLEIIEPLLNDKQLEDISCDGTKIPIYVYHRDSRLGSLRTNIQFNNRDELDSFVNKLAERCGRTISIAKPLLDGTLPEGSRVQTTLSSDIARRGSNFTIRLFTEKPLTPVDIINFGTCDIRLMAYFWFLIEHGSSVLISGGTATGKTSILNVLSMFIKPQMKIISIEDTAELKLPHSHWVPEVARTPISEEGKVDMFELLRESLRQRPDYIIVGEVRGKEAYVLFQQMAVGHPGLSTVHADSFTKLVDRLTSPPIELPPNLLQNLDAVLFLRRVKKGRKYRRRINTVTEVIGYDDKTKSPIVNEAFKWDPKTDSFLSAKSAILKKISDQTGMSEKEIREEIRKRAKVIEWMRKTGITDYRKVGAVINMFYASPEFLLERIEGGV